MKSVSWEVYYAAHRFGLVHAAGGAKGLQPRCTALKDAPTLADITEFLDAGGDVLSRKVKATTGDAHWLRADLAERAAARLLEESAESNRIAAEVCRFSLERDTEAARRAKMTLEAYRAQRNAALAKIDQRRGRNSVGI